MALSLSETAAKQVKQLKEAQKLPDSVFLRMGVKGGGCSGMSYMLEFDSERGPHDKEFEIDGVNEVTAREALRLAAAKLPIKTRVVARITEVQTP